MAVKFDSLPEMAAFVADKIKTRNPEFHVGLIQRLTGIDGNGDPASRTVRPEQGCPLVDIRVEESKAALVFTFECQDILVPMVKRKAVAAFATLEKVLEGIAIEHFGGKTFTQMEQSARRADKAAQKKAAEAHERVILEAKVAAQAERMSGNALYGSW